MIVPQNGSYRLPSGYAQDSQSPFDYSIYFQSQTDLQLSLLRYQVLNKSLLVNSVYVDPRDLGKSSVEVG